MADLVLTRNRKIKGLQIGLLVGILAALQFGPAYADDEITFIPLADMTSRMFALLLSGELTPHIIQTFSAVLLAIGLAIGLGVPAGLLLWRSSLLETILEPYLLLYYSIPFFAFYPLLVLIFGFGILPITLIALAFSVAIIVTNTAAGMANIPETYVMAGRDMNLSQYQLYRHVYFPAAAPYLFTGFKLGVIYALIGVISSEFILAQRGLGWLIKYNYSNFDMATMYAAMLFIILLALVLTTLLNVAENRIHGRLAG